MKLGFITADLTIQAVRYRYENFLQKRKKHSISKKGRGCFLLGRSWQQNLYCLFGEKKSCNQIKFYIFTDGLNKEIQKNQPHLMEKTVLIHQTSALAHSSVIVTAKCFHILFTHHIFITALTNYFFFRYQEIACWKRIYMKWWISYQTICYFSILKLSIYIIF